MDSEMAVTCFTDLEGSTAMTEKLGGEGMRPFRTEYLEVGKILANNCDGRYIKNIGDAHMIVFNKIESAFRFAAQLQQFYQPQPNYSKAPLSSRIGLFLGVIEQDKGDAFGSGVNQAARVERAADPGSVLLNENLMEAVTKIWGPESTQQFLSHAGSHDLKGIATPVELFSFNWQNYIKKYPDYSLSSLVYRHLQNASVIISNTCLSDISNQPSIIWPVVPRDGVNAIHRGQLEIIRLLAMIGSKVHILIADCGVSENFPRPYSDKFREMINDYASRRSLKDLNYLFMSDLFSPRCEGCDNLHRHFQSVISHLTLEDLLDINRKEYSKDIQRTINTVPTLDFLRPALTISSVLHLSDILGGKCIIVVGYDERKQWEGAHTSIPVARTQFGVLFNPVLKAKKGFQGRQTKNWPLYFNWEQVVDDMGKYDLAAWFTKLHLFLSSFPASSASIDDVSISPSEWLSPGDPEKRIYKLIKKTELAKYVFNKILTV